MVTSRDIATWLDTRMPRLIRSAALSDYVELSQTHHLDPYKMVTASLSSDKVIALTGQIHNASIASFGLVGQACR
jgi:hypothetical protein